MNRYWSRLSNRERRLALVSIALVAACIAAFVVMRARAYVASLDTQIAAIEEDLLYYNAIAARSYEVEHAFSQVATEHSSQVPEEEIYDGLRKEIQRLSLANPDSGEATPLLGIPALQPGRLTQSGQGFREYQITFQTWPAPIANIVLFLRRLQHSPQALRVDNLTLDRPPAEELITATFVVTRTIVNIEGSSSDLPAPGPSQTTTADAPPAPTSLRNTGCETWDGERCTGWEAEGCTLARTDPLTEGAAALRATATIDGAAVFQRVTLEAGRAYAIEVDAAVTGAATVCVQAEEPGAEPLASGECTGNGQGFTYRVPFTVPKGSDKPLRVPCFVLKKGAVVTLDNAVLTAAEGQGS